MTTALPTTQNPWLRQCDAGFEVGPNVEGNPVCLPVGGTIKVTQCNHPTTGIVQITGKLFKGYEPRQPTGFVSDPTNNQWWMRTFYVSDPEVEPYDEKNREDPDNFYLRAVIRMKEGGYVSGELIYIDTAQQYKFVCSYPLDDQTITDSFQITGQDVQDEASGTGYLKYTLELATDSVSNFDFRADKIKVLLAGNFRNRSFYNHSGNSELGLCPCEKVQRCQCCSRSAIGYSRSR